MSAKAFETGEPITLTAGSDAATGKVVAHWLADQRQVLAISFGDGSRHAIVVDLKNGIDGKSSVIVGPVNMITARQVALTLLSGRRPLLSVAAEANILAVALIALTEGAA